MTYGLKGFILQIKIIVPDRMHSYHHTAISEISRRIVGKILPHTIFLQMLDLRILLFGLQDTLVRSQSTEYQLCENNIMNIE